MRDYAETWRRKHEADPADQTAAINYARALRASTQYAQAVAVLEDAAVKHPYSTPVLAAYGKALADTGRLREAMDVLARAHTPDKPDWSVLSAQGAVADQLGDHAGALNYYDAALKIRPGEPSVMSNLGLSYALAKQLPQAEATLKTAAADPRADMRVRQNYALVLSLEGKFQLAEQVAATDLSAADAAESVSTIRQMIADSASWRDVQKADSARRAKSRKTHRRLSGPLDRGPTHAGSGSRAGLAHALGFFDALRHPGREAARLRRHRTPGPARAEHRLGLSNHAGEDLERFGHLAAEEGQLADMRLDGPMDHGPGGEEHDVAGSEPPRRRVAVVEHDRSFEDVDRFVDVVVPHELPRRAVPDQRTGFPIAALRQDGVAGRGIALDDPVAVDRR